MKALTLRHLSNVLLIIFAIQVASVSAKSVVYKNHSFELDYPSEWKEVRDFFGIPVTILGPFQKNESRPVIQIIPIGGKPLAFTKSEVEKWNENHDKNSRKWMKKSGGKLQSIWPGIVEKRPDGAKQLVAGLTYQLGPKSFFEKIIYISCPKGNYNIKILLNQGSKELLKPAEEIVGSFRCGK